jgi:hypothetical protein
MRIAAINLQERKHVKKLLSCLLFVVCAMSGTAQAQYSATNCNNIVQSSLNAAATQKQAVDAVGTTLTNLQNAAKACLTSMASMFSSGFGVGGFSSLLSSALNSIESAACRVITAPVTEVANQRYTLPGGLGSVGVNGSTSLTLPSVNVPLIGQTQLVQPTASSAPSFWSGLSHMLSPSK